MKKMWKKYEDTEYEISNYGEVRRYYPNRKNCDAEGYTYQKLTVDKRNGNIMFFVQTYSTKGVLQAHLRSLSLAIYNHFTDDPEEVSKMNTIIYIDNNPENCRRDNMITLNELRELAIEKNIFESRKF